MTTLTESDLKELKDLINSRFDDLKTQIVDLEKRLEVHIAQTNERLIAINQNIEDLKKQNDRQDNRMWILISALFLALFTAIAKSWFLPNP